MRVGLHLLDRCRHPNPQLGAVLPLPPPPLSLPSSGRRVAIVTGSNTGIGYETARTLVVQYGYTVILACQSRDKALAAAERINAQVTMANPKQKLNQQFSPTAPTAAAVFLHPLDLSNTASIRAFCAAVADQYSTIHVLINNAGRNTNGVIIPNETDVDSRPQQAETSTSKAGGPIRSHYDLLFHSNFLGHFLLTRILVDTILLRQTDEARIVNLSSVMHHFCAAEVEPAVAATKLHSTTSSPTETEYPEIAKQTKCTPPPPPPDCSFLGEVEFWKDVATAGRAPTDTYALSKLAAILFTLELNRRYSSSASNSGPVIRSLAVNPGSV